MDAGGNSLGRFRRSPRRRSGSDLTTALECHGKADPGATKAKHPPMCFISYNLAAAECVPSGARSNLFGGFALVFAARRFGFLLALCPGFVTERDVHREMIRVKVRQAPQGD